MRRVVSLTCAAAAVVLGFLVFGASRCSQQAAAADAGPDAKASPDSGLDASADAGADGDAEGGRYCTPEGGVTHDWPGYTRVDALDPCCMVDVPDDPDASMPALQWVPCTSGRANCQEINPTWRTDNIPSYFISFGISPDHFGAPILLHILANISSDDIEEFVFDFVSLEKLASWRSHGPSNCGVVAVAGDLGAGQLLTIHGVVSVSPYWRFAFGVPITDMRAPAFQIVPTSIVNISDVLQYPAASDSVIAFSAAFAGTIGRMQIDSGVYTVGSLPNDALADPLVIGSDVLASSHATVSGQWVREAVVKPDGTTLVLRERTAGHVSGFATDGTNLYWEETYGASNPSQVQPYGEIWMAPLTTDPATLAATATKISSTITGVASEDAVAFGGYYAVLDLPEQGAWVVRASDGATKWVPVSQGRKMGQVGYVSASEIWFIEDGLIAQQSGLSLVRVSYGSW